MRRRGAYFERVATATRESSWGRAEKTAYGPPVFSARRGGGNWVALMGRGLGGLIKIINLIKNQKEK